jgi:hypothetical protein
VMMLPTDKPNLFQLLQGVYDFYAKDLSEFALSVWWAAMKPFDLPAVKDALNRHCVNPDGGQFLPKPADVIKLLAGGTQDASLVAWSKVDRAVRSIGTYRSVCFDDPIVNAVISDMGGWVSLGIKREDEWPFVAREFENRYRGYRLRGRGEVYPRHLPGIAERDNMARGLSHAEVVLIGNAEAAQRVMDGGVDVRLSTTTINVIVNRSMAQLEDKSERAA